jgi:hypothetical protein
LAKPKPKQKAVHQEPSPSRIDVWERTLEDKLDWLVAALLALAFVAHASWAGAAFLNPDEVLHYNLAHQRTVAEAWRANNTNAHPPLFILLLWAWMHLGHSELFLRMIPLLAWCGFLWFFYRWMRLISSPAAALAAAALAALMPPILQLATEVRHYTLMLFGMSAAMYFFERALSNHSPRAMAAGGLFLLWAIASNYSALWFTAAFGLYGVCRIVKTPPPARQIALWAASQLCAAGLYGLFYVTHIASLTNAAISQQARQGWLRHVYFLEGDRASEFVIRNGWSVFRFLFGSTGAGAIGLALFALGLGLLFTRRAKVTHSPALTLLIVAPFLACLAAALAGMYPFGGTRHSSVFAFFAAIPASLAAAHFAKHRLVIMAAVLLAAVPLSMLTADEQMQSLRFENQRVELMREAVNYLKSQVPQGGIVYTDYHSVLALCYYYDPKTYCHERRRPGLLDYSLDRFRVVSSDIWIASPSRFVEDLKQIKQEDKLPQGAEVWTFSAGWGIPLHKMVQLQFAGAHLPGLKEFGPHIGVFRVPN